MGSGPIRCLTIGKRLSCYIHRIGHCLAIRLKLINKLMVWESNYDIMFSEKEYRSIYKNLKYIKKKTPNY